MGCSLAILITPARLSIDRARFGAVMEAEGEARHKMWWR
jgi:hypothetical protein